MEENVINEVIFNPGEARTKVLTWLTARSANFVFHTSEVGKVVYNVMKGLVLVSEITYQKLQIKIVFTGLKYEQSFNFYGTDSYLFTS